MPENTLIVRLEGDIQSLEKTLRDLEAKGATTAEKIAIHEAICNLRYTHIDERLQGIDKKVDRLTLLFSGLLLVLLGIAGAGSAPFQALMHRVFGG